MQCCCIGTPKDTTKLVFYDDTLSEFVGTGFVSSTQGGGAMSSTPPKESRAPRLKPGKADVLNAASQKRWIVLTPEQHAVALELSTTSLEESAATPRKDGPAGLTWSTVSVDYSQSELQQEDCLIGPEWTTKSSDQDQLSRTAEDVGFTGVPPTPRDGPASALSTPRFLENERLHSCIEEFANEPPIHTILSVSRPAPRAALGVGSRRLTQPGEIVSPKALRLQSIQAHDPVGGMHHRVPQLEEPPEQETEFPEIDWTSATGLHRAPREPEVTTDMRSHAMRTSVVAPVPEDPMTHEEVTAIGSNVATQVPEDPIMLDSHVSLAPNADAAWGLHCSFAHVTPRCNEPRATTLNFAQLLTEKRQKVASERQLQQPSEGCGSPPDGGDAPGGGTEISMSPENEPSIGLVPPSHVRITHQYVGREGTSFNGMQTVGPPIKLPFVVNSPISSRRTRADEDILAPPSPPILWSDSSEPMESEPWLSTRVQSQPCPEQMSLTGQTLAWELLPRSFSSLPAQDTMSPRPTHLQPRAAVPKLSSLPTVSGRPFRQRPQARLSPKAAPGKRGSILQPSVSVVRNSINLEEVPVCARCAGIMMWTRCGVGSFGDDEWRCGSCEAGDSATHSIRAGRWSCGHCHNTVCGNCHSLRCWLESDACASQPLIDQERVSDPRASASMGKSVLAESQQVRTPAAMPQVVFPNLQSCFAWTVGCWLDVIQCFAAYCGRNRRGSVLPHRHT